ncbi:MAG TPA: caspase family protein [Steroidobacteraceae bacterium]|nr:caspase family protein [Steroidobacteraceae bacterium]
MPTGRALCIGVDTAASPGGLAEADACALADVARQQGFCSSTLLLGPEATIDRVRSRLRAAAAESQAGDLFLIAFSGHGGRKPVHAPRPGADGASSSTLRGVWVLYDGSLDDAAMHAELAAFRPGVRILVISDSCNGGVPGQAIDAVPERAHHARIAASVLVLSACSPERFADGPGMPAHFTTALLRAWHDGGRALDHRRFYEKVAAEMPAYQRPTYYWVGMPDARFEAQAPFTI